jgi:hypothetical protein
MSTPDGWLGNRRHFLGATAGLAAGLAGAEAGERKGSERRT